jgi:hypothetical protein
LFRLTARFDIAIQGEFLFKRPVSDDLCYKITIRDFEVELCLNPNAKSYQKRPVDTPEIFANDSYWGSSKVRIQTSRNEIIPPPVPRTIDERTSYEWHKYFEERKPAHRQVAWETLNRAILFFKYRLHNPNLSLLNQYSSGFQNPFWIDESGKEIGNVGITIVMERLPSLDRFGICSLSRQDDSSLENSLRNPILPELVEELISDAQSAVFQQNLRRAILETAIACEIAVKQAFFAKATPAGVAYEFLEDKGKVRVTAIELIDSVAKQAFGKSFKEDERVHFNNIDFLFRCRNKVAHRGELTYKDDSGMHFVDNDTLAVWWESVETLLEWLHANVSGKEITE